MKSDTMTRVRRIGHVSHLKDLRLLTLSLSTQVHRVVIRGCWSSDSPEENSESVGDEQRQAHQQRESLGVLSACDLPVLRHIGQHAADNHRCGSQVAKDVAHGQFVFVADDPIHCESFEIFLFSRSLFL